MGIAYSFPARIDSLPDRLRSRGRGSWFNVPGYTDGCRLYRRQVRDARERDTLIGRPYVDSGMYCNSRFFRVKQST